MRIAPAANHLDRQARLLASLAAAEVDALLVSASVNIAYLTGFFGSAGLLLAAPDRFRLIVDGRYTTTAERRRHDLPGLDVIAVPTDSTYEEVVAGEVARLEVPRVGIEGDQLTVRRLEDLRSRLASVGASKAMVTTSGVVERLRMVKDAWEIGVFREAGARLSDAAKCIIPKVLAGASERDVAGAVEQELRRVGFERPAFDTIVASGPNAALPHYRPGERRLEPGDLVVLDFGGVLDGYSVDLTRTRVVGRAGQRERRLLEQVAEAQQAAFESIAVGRPADEVDAAARGVLEREGLGEAFVHGTGHGLGLEIHERPRISRRRAGQGGEPLEAGMVFTLEPGAYLAGWGGARIEDDVLVTPGGGEWLTGVPAAGH